MTSLLERVRAKCSETVNATIYERVLLRRTASELGTALDEQARLEASLLDAQTRIVTLEAQLRDYQAAAEEALISCDRTIAQMAEQNAPEILTDQFRLHHSKLELSV